MNTDRLIGVQLSSPKYYASMHGEVVGPYDHASLVAAFARGGAWADGLVVSRGLEEGWLPPQAFPELALPAAQPVAPPLLKRRSRLALALGQYLVAPWFIWAWRTRLELDPSSVGRSSLQRDLALVVATCGFYAIAVEYGLAKEAARLDPRRIEPGFPTRFLKLRLASLLVPPLGLIALYMLQDRLNLVVRDRDRELVFGAPVGASGEVVR